MKNTRRIFHVNSSVLCISYNNYTPVYQPRRGTSNISFEVRSAYRKIWGITSFIRSSAVGLWKDDSMMYEAMADTLDTAWRRNYRKQLCILYKQEELINRAGTTQLL